jgi:hypothetical protein
MSACAINDRIQRKLDYTQEEVRVLKEIVVALAGNGRLSSPRISGVGWTSPARFLAPKNRRSVARL